MEAIRDGEFAETDIQLEERLRKVAQDEARYGTGIDPVTAIIEEVERAKRHGKAFASLHEAYAVILEEVDEVWDITRQKRCLRNELELRKELIQIAAMALKALASMENFIGGHV